MNFHSDFVATPLFGLVTLGWGALTLQEGLGPLTRQEGPLQPRSLLIIDHHTQVWGELICISAPPTSLAVASSLYP